MRFGPSELLIILAVIVVAVGFWRAQFSKQKDSADSPWEDVQFQMEVGQIRLGLMASIAATFILPVFSINDGDFTILVINWLIGLPLYIFGLISVSNGIQQRNKALILRAITIIIVSIVIKFGINLFVVNLLLSRLLPYSLYYGYGSINEPLKDLVGSGWDFVLAIFLFTKIWRFKSIKLDDETKLDEYDW